MSFTKYAPYFRFGKRSYKIASNIIDDFYEYCTQRQLTPTLTRLISYIEYGAKHD